MRRLPITLLLALLISSSASAQSLISCASDAPESDTSGIWPEPYISNTDELCFNVKDWPEYSGKNCAPRGGSARWKGDILLVVDGESKGRDLFDFRVVNPKVTNQHIEYLIEWKRDGDWQPMQNISINRLTGNGVRYFTTEHGGHSYQCRSTPRKF